jgi:branched-chain amino acid transport system substrate-binding protein
MTKSIRVARHAVAALAGLWLAAMPAQAADPIKIGMSLALTGAGAPAGKMLQAAIEIWRDDVNAKGGLLGRPVEIIVYDDQSTPASVPGLYTKLISVDKADLLLGPYGTNFVAPVMPTIIQNKKMLISYTAIGINDQYKYDKYFSMVPVGSDGVNAFSKGFFEMAAKQNPKPQTVAIIAADAEFAQAAAQGAREEMKKHGMRLVFDKSYPPATTDFTPVMRAVQAANADIVYAGAYPPDSVGIVRAANEIGLNPKIFGGALIGQLVTPIKAQLGPIQNGIIIHESFVPSPKLNFPGLDELMKRYQAKAAELKTDPIGFAFVPFGYTNGQILEQAITATKSLDDNKLADYIGKTTFKTIMGDVKFGKGGEWAEGRMLQVQYHDIKNTELEQFRGMDTQTVLTPPQFKTGDVIYPFEKAK